MFEKEIEFLQDNITLLENNKWEDLYKSAQSSQISWEKILEICYSPELRINPFIGLQKVPAEYSRGFGRFPAVLVLPDTITEIGDESFANSNIQKIQLPKSLIKIGDSAFSRCQYLQNIDLPDSLVTLDSFAFHNCVYLRELIIPDSVTTIGRDAFYACYNLTKLVLPLGLQKINRDIIYNTNLSNIFYVNTDDIKQVWPNKIEVAQPKLYENIDIVSYKTGEIFGQLKDFMA